MGDDLKTAGHLPLTLTIILILAGVFQRLPMSNETNLHLFIIILEA